MQAITTRKVGVNKKPMIVAKGWIEAVAVMPATVTSKVATMADQSPS
jgi:hypothetical protein